MSTDDPDEEGEIAGVDKYDHTNMTLINTVYDKSLNIQLSTIDNPN